MKAGLSEQEAHTKLCEDAQFARDHNFDDSEFVKNPEDRLHEEGEFDLQSIMLYETTLAAPMKCFYDITACPLVYYRKSNGQIAGLERIPTNEVPSRGDVEWVRKWYPWMG